MSIEEGRSWSGCPLCPAGTGQPYRTAPYEQDGSVRLLLQCDTCHHRWSLIVTADTGAKGLLARTSKRLER